MRTHKSSSSTNFTEYFHDAQMSMEDSAVNGSNLTVTRYGLGARGIDYEEVAEVRYAKPRFAPIPCLSPPDFAICFPSGITAAKCLQR